MKVKVVTDSAKEEYKSMLGENSFMSDKEYLNIINELIVPEEQGILHVYKSKNAEMPFDAKQFKKDMKSSNTDAKVMCLVFAYDDMGLFPEMVLGPGLLLKEKNLFAATEELYDMGYTDKYEVEGLGYFYKANRRSMQALVNRVSRSFLMNYVKEELILSILDQDYIVEGIHAAKLRILASSIMESLYDPHSLFMANAIMKKHYFLFENIREDIPYKVYVTGILSKDPKDFDALTELIKDVSFDKNQLVVCAYTNQYAKYLSQWLISKNPSLKENKVGYMLYKDDVIYSLNTDEPLIFSTENIENEMGDSADVLLKDIPLEDILTKKDPDCLTYLESPKAKYTFTARRFIKDISGYYQPAMIFALARIANPGVFKAIYSEARDDKIYEDLVASVERIYNFGYFGRFTVENMDSFYVLTKKGKKAFETRETANLINEISYVGEVIYNPNASQINDSNQAKMILMLIEATDKAQIRDETESNEEYQVIREPYDYILGFPTKDGAWLYIGWVIDEKELLPGFKNQLLQTIRNYETIKGLVVSGLNKKQAVSMANLVADRFELPFGKEKVYYTVYGEKEIYNLMTGEQLKSS
ncbi:MAG: hypothetical protein J6E46_13490 [Faecalicoccus sp.]|nr:hypothetical protein [Faecalicoccus sp.]